MRVSLVASTNVYWFLYVFVLCIRLFRVFIHVSSQLILLFIMSHNSFSHLEHTAFNFRRKIFCKGCVFILQTRIIKMVFVLIFQSRLSAYCSTLAWKNYSTKGWRFHPCTETTIHYLSRILKITGYKE